MKQYKKRKYRSGAADTRYTNRKEYTEHIEPVKEHQTSTYGGYSDGYNGYEHDTAQGAQQRPSSASSGQKPPRKKKKRRKKRYLLKFFILLALCVGLYCFLHSSIFNLEKVIVSGGERFTAEQIQDMAHLKTGTNLFEFKAGDCEERLLDDPYIKAVHIKRKLPATVEIKLTERKEKAVFVQDKQYIVIDLEGIVLRIADKDPKQPVLAGITVTKAKENQPVEVKEQYGLKKAIKLLAAMEEADLYFKTIDVSKLIVRLYVTDKLYCKGEAKNLLIGMEEGDLKAVLYDLYKRKIKKGVVNVGDEQYYSYSKKIK